MTLSGQRLFFLFYFFKLLLDFMDILFFFIRKGNEYMFILGLFLF